MIPVRRLWKAPKESTADDPEVEELAFGIKMAKAKDNDDASDGGSDEESKKEQCRG